MENRRDLYATLPEGTLFLAFAGKAPRQSADAFHPFFADRNFVYLTGLGGAEPQSFVLLARKGSQQVEETLYILPPDAHAERWNGRRLRPDEVTELSGVADTAPLEQLEGDFHRFANSGLYGTVALDLFKLTADEAPDAAHRFAQRVAGCYPSLGIHNCHQQLRIQRTIKKPCEIEAMKKAMTITKKGILAMMRASKPGMYEYQYKALFDHALADEGVLTPAFPSIISAAENNFCIHYYSYTGQAQDGDLILNDVGACWDNICTDVSRGWPCDGTFNERQRLLYDCAYKTSEHMFSIIKPGMPMADVDRLSHEYCAVLLTELGLIDSAAEVGKLMWHGGAHHVGYDVHDVVYAPDTIAPGMVFCVDIGIYCEEWGIGFRLEDNCLVTETGCVNLSAGIPRSIEEIEAVMART